MKDNVAVTLIVAAAPPSSEVPTIADQPTPSETIATETLVAGTVAVNILSLEMTSALQVSRLQSMLRAVSCHGRSQVFSLDRTSHPLGIALGPEHHTAERVGAAVGNVALVVGVMGLHGLLALAMGAAQVGFPSRTMTVLLYFFQPVLSSSLFIVAYTDVPGLRALGVGMLLVVVAPVAVIAYITIGARFTPTYTPKEDDAPVLIHDDDDTSTAKIGYLQQFLKYASRRLGDWQDSMEDDGYCKRFKAYFNDYAAPYQNFLLFEFFLSTCLGVLDFQVTKTIEHCRALNGLLFCALIVHVSLVLYLRPFAKPMTLHFFLITTALQILSSGVSFTKSLLNEDVEEDASSSSTLALMLTKTATITVLLSSVIFFVKTLLTVLMRLHKIRQKVVKKLEKSVTKAMFHGDRVDERATGVVGLLGAEHDDADGEDLQELVPHVPKDAKIAHDFEEALLAAVKPSPKRPRKEEELKGSFSDL